MRLAGRSAFILLSMFAVLSCSGNTDTEENELHISADKTVMEADGTDKVTFKVTYGADDVSTSTNTSITLQKDNSRTALDPGTNVFMTDEPGEYTFSALYSDGGNEISSDDMVKVTANTPAPLSSGYYRRMLAMKFTSIHCTYCPILAEAIEKVEENYSGRIIPASFHVNSMGDDPMTQSLNGKIYDKVATGEGLPLFAFDFRKSSKHIVNEYAKILSEMEHQLGTYPCTCGVAIDTRYDASSRKLEVDAKFRCDVAGSYRYHIFLVEDGIGYMQAGHEGKEQYIHNDVVRKIVSDNVYGTRIELGKTLVPGREYSVNKTFDMATEWKIENMRVIACILDSADGSTYSCNNSNECAVGGKADYLYEK